MLKKTLSALSISLVVAQIREYGAIGSHHCLNDIWHYATSYYSTKLDSAHEKCKDYDCDIIVQWSRVNNQGITVSAYDIGIFGGKTCKKNDIMTAEVKWSKYDDNYSHASNTTVSGWFLLIFSF